jgi:hypothetical protein
MELRKAAWLMVVATANFLTVAQAQNGGPKPSPRVSVPTGAKPVAVQQTQPAVALLSAPAQPVAAQSPAVSAPSGNSTAAVDYASGQLTVVAEKASLGHVLKLVAARTGAVVDLAPELQSELVVARLGPGSVREVLSLLLDSPGVDYIVMGTGDEPGSLLRVVVRTRHSSAGASMAAVSRTHAQQEDAEDRENADANNRAVLNGSAAASSPLTQQQMVENWNKAREARRLAEIRQQQQDIENEKTQPSEPPAQENPPQR